MSDRCECGHPKSAHNFDRSIPAAPKDKCQGTVYEHGTNWANAWPCPCRKFTEQADHIPKIGTTYGWPWDRLGIWPKSSRHHRSRQA